MPNVFTASTAVAAAVTFTVQSKVLENLRAELVYANPQYAEQVASTYSRQIPMQSRTRAEITDFFNGLTFVGPGEGVVTAPEWFTDDDMPPQEASAVYVGVAVKG